VSKINEAINSFKNNEFIKAENIFEQLLSSKMNQSDLANLYFYTLEVKKKLKRKDLERPYSEYLNYLNESKQFASLNSLFKEAEESKVCFSFQDKCIYLNSLWECGQISTYDQTAKFLCSYLLENKLWNIADDFINKICAKRRYQLYPRFSKLMYLSHINDNKQLHEYSLSFISFLENEWVKVEDKHKKQSEYIEQIRCTIESCEEKNSNVEILLKYFNLYLSDNNKSHSQYSKDDVIKALILFSENPEVLVKLIHQKLSSTSKQELAKFCYATTLNKNQLLKNNPNIKTYVRPSVNIKINRPDDSEGIEWSNISMIQSNLLEVTSAKQTQRDHLISSDEQEFMTRIKLDDPEILIASENFIYSFISLDMYQAALLLLDKMEVGTNQSYLKAEIYINIHRYADVVDIVNGVLQELNFDFSKQIPFLYLKAEALYGLGKKNEALKTYNRILVFDPDYRQVKERVKR